MKRTFLATLFFVILVLIWHFIVQANIWSPVLLPSPKSVGEYLLSAARDGTLLQATTVTVRRLLVGYFIGIAIGLPLGLFLTDLSTWHAPFFLQFATTRCASSVAEPA